MDACYHVWNRFINTPYRVWQKLDKSIKNHLEMVL